MASNDIIILFENEKMKAHTSSEGKEFLLGGLLVSCGAVLGSVLASANSTSLTDPVDPEDICLDLFLTSGCSSTSSASS